MNREVREDQHGTKTGYSYGCRCDFCRIASREYQRQRKRDGKIRSTSVRRYNPKPELTAAWKQAYEMGLSDQFCDRIVKEREVPATLLAALGFDPDYYAQ